MGTGPMSQNEPGHIPVLADEVMRLLDPQPGDIALDCTLGRGGHAAMIAEKIGESGTLVGLDLDPANVEFTSQRLSHLPATTHCIHAGFAESRRVLDELGIDKVNLLLADLGFASNQMDDPQRGFSFLNDGPLDMRLNTQNAQTAADLVNELPEKELADTIYEFGEERFSRRIARRIVERRKQSRIETTSEMAAICRSAYGPRGHRMRIHPATRTFMALRIAVNDELRSLHLLLESLPTLLAPSARTAIISFHSLEDRPVKRAFLALQQDEKAERLTRKPIKADDAEIRRNSRARSAKLRAIRWI